MSPLSLPRSQKKLEGGTQNHNQVWLGRHHQASHGKGEMDIYGKIILEVIRESSLIVLHGFLTSSHIFFRGWRLISIGFSIIFNKGLWPRQ